MKMDIRPKSIRWILFLTQLKILIIVGYIGFSLNSKKEQAEVLYALENLLPILIISSIVLYSIKTKYILVVRVCLIFDLLYAFVNAPPLGIAISMLLLVLSYTETAKIYLDPICANKRMP
jgi:hypothetical protein